jgi:hypothetical protein
MIIRDMNVSISYGNDEAGPTTASNSDPRPSNSIEIPATPSRSEVLVTSSSNITRTDVEPPAPADEPAQESAPNEPFRTSRQVETVM